MSQVTTDLTCKETMPSSDEKLDARPGYRPPSALYGGPSTSTAQQRFPQIPKPAASRALYPGSLIPSMSGLPHGLALPGSAATAVPRISSPNPLLAANAASAIMVAQREMVERELRREQAKKKDEEEMMKINSLLNAGPSTSSAHPGIIRPTPTMGSLYGNPLLQPLNSHGGGGHPQRPGSSSAGLLAGHDYIASTPPIREQQVKQIPKGGGLVHAPYNPAMKSRLENQRDPAPAAHTIARPIPRHGHVEQPSSAAQFALNQAAQAQQEAQLLAHKRLTKDQREAELRAQLQQQQQILMERERQRLEEERQIRADMSGIAPIVRPVQRGNSAQPILDPSRLNRGLPTPLNNRLTQQQQNMSMAQAMATAAAAAHAQAQQQKEKDELEKFLRERDRLERAAAEPMQLPPAQHSSPIHIPSILQGRNNWPKLAQSNSPLRPNYSPGLGGGLNSTALGATGGIPASFDQLLGLNSNPYARLNLFGANSPYGLGQHVSPSPSTPQVHATPSPRPSILRRKANESSGGGRTNYKAVAAAATAHLRAAAPPAATRAAPSPQITLPKSSLPSDSPGIFDYDSSDDMPARPPDIDLNELVVKQELTDDEEAHPMVIHRPIAIRPDAAAAGWPLFTVSPSPSPQQQQQKRQRHRSGNSRKPSILQQPRPTAKRRLGFDESNPQTVGELATAQLASGVIGLSDAKKIKMDVDVKKEPLDIPSSSSAYLFSSLHTPLITSGVKLEPGASTSAEPTPQKKRQRKQQFDANQAPEQIRMQISDPPYVPIMGMHSAEYPGEMLYYQLPPEAPKKKRGRPSSLAKEQALLEAQTTTRSVIVDVDEPKIVLEKKKGNRKKAQNASQPVVPPANVKEEPLDVPFTPPPPRPSSSARPKSAILQQHHAALQLQLQQHQQRQSSQTPLQSPPAAEQSPFTYAAVDDFPLEFDSDEELVSADALAAAKECAEQLGLVGPDGEPRETTPVRLAREQEEAEEEEERNREMIERINSAGLQQLQAAIRKKEELDRLEKEDEEREEKESQAKERSALRLIDRRLRFLSHDQSIIRRFFRKVKGGRRDEIDSDEDRYVASEDDEEKEGMDKSHGKQPSRSKDSETLTLSEEALQRLRKRREEFDVVREVEEADSDDEDDDAMQEKLRRQKRTVERMNVEMRLESLLKKKRKLKHQKNEELEAEIEKTQKRLEELNEPEDREDDEKEENVAEPSQEKRKPLIPLDALGDRDDFIRAHRKLIIAPSATPRLKTKKDLAQVGKKKEVKKALGFMQLWKRAHCSSEDARGIVMEEPVDVEADLMKARRRDTMIERAFNRLRKQADHDRERAKIREEIIGKRNADRRRTEFEEMDDDQKSIRTLADEMLETIEKEEKEAPEVEKPMEKQPKTTPAEEEPKSETKEEVENAGVDEKMDDSEKLEEEKGEGSDEEKEEEDQEEEMNPIERSRIQKDNDEILRRAIEEVDAKILRRDQRGVIAKSLQTYFGKPSGAVHDASLLGTISALQKHHLDEEYTREDLEELLEELSSSSDEEEERGEKKSDNADEDANVEVEVSAKVLKMTATKKTRLDIPTKEWDSLLSSFQQAKVVDLFGVPFAQCADQKFVPVVTVEEQELARNAHLTLLKERTVQKVESTLAMEQRYQDTDALPRAVTRFRRCEAVDNAMMRGEMRISEEIDPELATLEDQAIGFLTDNIHSTKRDALLEKQIMDLEKKKDATARSASPIMFYKRNFNKKSILANYTLEYNPREKWARDDEDDSPFIDQQNQFVRQQYKRREDSRKATLDSAAERAISQREVRFELPCPSKKRQDAAKERILEKYSKKTRALMLQAYDQFFDDEGQELNSASTSGGRKASGRKSSSQSDKDEDVFARTVRMAKFVERHGLDVEKLPTRAGSLKNLRNSMFNRLKEVISDSEAEDGDEQADAEIGGEEKKGREEDIEDDGTARFNHDEIFDLEDIRKLYESEDDEDVVEEDSEAGDVDDEDDLEEQSTSSECDIRLRDGSPAVSELYDFSEESSDESDEDDVEDCEEQAVESSGRNETKEGGTAESDVKNEDPHAEEEEGEPSEESETKDEEEDKYEDHVVTMTRGGKTITQIVRRPSNATALMKIPPPPKSRKMSEVVYTKVNSSGKVVRVLRRKVVKKMTEDEQYLDYQNKASTRFVTIPESDPMLIDEDRMMSDLKTMSREATSKRKIHRRRQQWEVTEDEKAQMTEEIEDELDQAEAGPSMFGRRGIDEKDEEMVGNDEGRSDYYDSDEEETPDCIRLDGSSSGEEEEDEDQYDVSALRPFKNAKAVDTTEEAKSFPWLVEVGDYDPIAMNASEHKLVALRENLLEEIERKKEAIKPKVYRFKLPPKEKQQRYISPFHSLYEEELPDALENDLSVLKLIMTTCLNDETISSSELVALRKKINLSKRGFAEVIKRKTIEPPKAFKDLVRFAIQRGEKYTKETVDLKSIKKWQNRLESRKIRRAKRKAILKEVKVTRHKLNARFGRKFHRTDWTLRRELEARWRKDHLLPECATPPSMGNKQFLQEMRKMKEVSAEHKLLGLGADLQKEIEVEKKKREVRELSKERRRAEKGKTKPLYRLTSGLSWDGDEAEEAEIRSKDILRGTIIMFDRRTEEIEYSDDDEAADDAAGKFSDDCASPRSEASNERNRRERSWTYETVKNSSDDESFVDFGHSHWIGPQVFLDGREMSPLSDDEVVTTPTPKLVIPAGAFSDAHAGPSGAAGAANDVSLEMQPAPLETPTKPEPRPFLTLAQKKAYFTEETEEQKKQKEEEEKKRKAEEERLRIEEEKKAEEKRKEEARIAEEERLEKEEEEKFDDIMGQIEQDTWEKQLKMIIDRTMTTFRRTEAIEYLLASCDDMDCDEEKLLEEVELWEEAAAKKRISTCSTDYMPLKSLFEAESSAVLRKGVKVVKKKDALNALPDSVLIEDLVDSMCTFIAAHIDDVTILSELRMTSDKRHVKIRTVAPPAGRNELLVKKSIASVGIDEAEMVERTLEDTAYNTLTVVGATSSGVILTARRASNPLLDEVNVELRKRDDAEAEIDVVDAAQVINDPNFERLHLSRLHGSDFECVRQDLCERLGISSKAEVDSFENAIIEDAIERGKSPDLEAVLDYACEEEEKPAPITSNKAKKALEHKGIRAIRSGSCGISDSIIKEISEQLRTAENLQHEKLDMPQVENKKLHDEFLRMRDVTTAVRNEMEKKIGEVIDEAKLDQYLLEHVWSDEGSSSNVQMMVADIKKQRERERRSLIDIGDVPARVFDLSAVGQLERWMDDVFYLSPFSEDGKRIVAKLSTREDALLNYQLVLRSEDDDEDENVKRIHPEIVMKWTEEEEEKSEVVHKFSAIPAHQWDSIQRLIRLARQEREEEGVVSDDEERPVLIPAKSQKSGVVVVEKSELAIDQEAIVNNDKFVDLELRHSARLLKHKTVGFDTKKAVNLWRKNFNRAFKTGRVMKTIVDDNEPATMAAAPDIRQSIRYKCLQNSIKQAKGITKERVEVLGEGMREDLLKKARGAVRRQKRLIRMHYKKRAVTEMRAYNAEIKRVESLRIETKVMRADTLNQLFGEKVEVKEVILGALKTVNDDKGTAFISSADVPDMKSLLPLLKSDPVDAALTNDHVYFKANAVRVNAVLLEPTNDALKADQILENHASSKTKENCVGGDAEKETESYDSESDFGLDVAEGNQDDFIVEGESGDEDEEEQEIREVAAPLHPLKRPVKTLEELSRPLTTREAQLLEILKEKRSKGETLLSVDDLKKKPALVAVEDAFLLEDSDDGEEVDLECVLFHSYPDRIKRVLMKAMERREERIRVHSHRYEMYRRREERRKRKEKELLNDMEEKKDSPKEESIEEDVKIEEKEEQLVVRPGMLMPLDEIPRGFCPRWMKKTINGQRMMIRTVAYRNFKRRMQLRRERVIMGRVSRSRKVPLTRLHCVIDGPKSSALIKAEQDAERTKANLENLTIDVDTSHIPITKEVLGQFVENQVKSDDAKLKFKKRLIDDHDRGIQKKGVRFLDDDVAVALDEQKEIGKMIDEARSHEHAIETYRDVVQTMHADAVEKLIIDPIKQVDLELEEAIDNERRVLQDFLKMIQAMDSLRFQELTKLWAFDIDSDDDDESLEEKRWARVRQFVLQKPQGALRNWKSDTAYVDEWEEKNGLPKKREIVEAMGPLGPYFRGETNKKREGFFVTDEGFPVKPKKPQHFRPLESDPEYLDNSDIDDMCHSDLNARHEDNLMKRKIVADHCNREFVIRQEDVRKRGLKRKAELMKKFKKTDKNMPVMGDGLYWAQEQNSVFDPMPVIESYWSHRRRVDPKINALLRRRLENTREMFAAVIQPMYRTILVLRETKDRLAHHLETKDLDSDEERRHYEESSESDSDEEESETEENDEEEHPTYVLRKRPRLCTRDMLEDDEDGDDEDEDSDRAPSRSDSEREESGSDEEEESEGEEPAEAVIEDESKKPKKPTLFNREIKREEVCSPDLDTSKVKEEEDQDVQEVTDETPKRRIPQIRKNRGRPRKSGGSGRSDSESPFYEAPPTSLRRALGKRPLINDKSAVDFYDEDEQIRLAIEESLKDQPSTSTSGNF